MRFLSYRYRLYIYNLKQKSKITEIKNHRNQKMTLNMDQMLNFSSKPYQISIIFTIVIILVLLVIYRNFANINYLVSGFYIAPPEFCAGAGLDSFLMYIGDPSFFSRSRHGYILATQGEKMVINTPVDMCFTWDWMSINNLVINLKHTSQIEGKLAFREEIDGIPKTLLVLASPTSGKLVLSDSENVYAILYRDAHLTEQIAKKLESGQLDEK